jgi:hypothetical protein
MRVHRFENGVNQEVEVLQAPPYTWSCIERLSCACRGRSLLTGGKKGLRGGRTADFVDERWVTFYKTVESLGVNS